MRSVFTGILLVLSLYCHSQENILGEFRLMLSAGDTVNAMFMLERDLLEEPENWTLRYNLAILQLKTGDINSAVENFEKVTSQNDSLLEPYYYLGNFYFDQDSARKAEYYFSMYLSESPDNREVRHKRAQSNMKLGDNYSAISDWSYLAKLDNNPNILFNRGLARLALNDLEGAIEDFAKVIEANEEYVDAWYFTGLAYYNSYQVREAEQSWSRIIEIDPDYTNAWYQLSFLNWQKGKRKKTCKYIEKAFKLGWRPNGDEGREILNYCNQ